MDPTIVSQVVAGGIGNVLTLGLAGFCYIVYQRCQTCDSKCHTSWLTCESQKMKQKKENQKIDLLLKALEIHQRRSTHLGIQVNGVGSSRKGTSRSKDSCSDENNI